MKKLKRRKKIFNKVNAKRKEKLVKYREALKAAPTKSEQRIKAILQQSFPRHIRFQVIIGPFIVDFLHRKKSLIIEIDGSSHNGKEEYDRNRQAWLEKHGFQFLRFTNDDVWYRKDVIVKAVEAAPYLKSLNRCRKEAEEDLLVADELRTKRELANSTVKIPKGRQIVNGQRLRPRCPNCSTAVSSQWLRCEGCQARIEFV